jgi:hypothetical protein
MGLEEQEEFFKYYSLLYLQSKYGTRELRHYEYGSEKD